MRGLELRRWLSDRTTGERVKWLRDGVARWVADDTGRTAILHPLQLQDSLPLVRQVCDHLAEAGGDSADLIAEAVEVLMESWNPYSEPEVFGEYALFAGYLGCSGLPHFLRQLRPDEPVFSTAGLQKRRNVISSVVEAVRSHPRFFLPLTDRPSPLFDQIMRIRRDFRRQDIPLEDMVWLPADGAGLADMLAMRDPLRFFEAYAALREDFVDYCRENPRTGFRLLQKALRNITALDLGRALEDVDYSSEWLLEYIFSLPGEITTTPERPDWHTLVFADWIDQTDQITLQYFDVVYLEAFAGPVRAEPGELTALTKSAAGAARVLASGTRTFFERTLPPRPPTGGRPGTVVPFKRVTAANNAFGD